MIISFNGIERIGKSYYCGILNNYLKERKGEENIRKFTFPSYTTSVGQKIAKLIKQFKTDDLLALNPHSHNRYKRIAEHLIANYNEYSHFITSQNVALVNNNYFSVLAHGMAADVSYNDIKNILGDIYLASEKTLAFFLISSDVKKTLTAPYRTHEYRENDTISQDYVNYFIMVNNYYKQIFMTNFHSTDSEIKPVLIEIDLSDNDHVSKTIDRIKHEVSIYVE